MIYNLNRMHTVRTMGKRILTLATGVALGALAVPGLLHLGLLWGLFPSRDLNHASGYVREVLQLVNENYVDAQASSYDELARSAIHGMVESLDPHSEFMEAKDNEQLEEDLSGEFGGIGVEVETRADRIVVVSPIAGTPGDRAGILRGDEITGIDGHRLGGGASRDDVVGRLRGKPKTRVTVSLYRPSTGKNFDLMLTREIIKVDSVGETRVLDGDVGYVQLKEFSEHTGEEFVAAVNRLLKQNINSLIIDLRNNPGGLLDAAVEVAEPFFRKGEIIVYTQGRKPSDREDYRAEADGEPLDLPVAVLINAGTASAAEIVTGALKDTGRAVIVGERSFGKGSVQAIFKLKDGEALRLTTAKYYTPSGVSIHEKGIAPQVEVIMTPDEDSKLWQQHARPDLIGQPAEFKAVLGFDPIEDRQLQTAVDVLKGVDMLDGQADAAAIAAKKAGGGR
jgi:carboxyl-terminal processing protease